MVKTHLANDMASEAWAYNGTSTLNLGKRWVTRHVHLDIEVKRTLSGQQSHSARDGDWNIREYNSILASFWGFMWLDMF